MKDMLALKEHGVLIDDEILGGRPRGMRTVVDPPRLLRGMGSDALGAYTEPRIARAIRGAEAHGPRIDDLLDDDGTRIGLLMGGARGLREVREDRHEVVVAARELANATHGDVDAQTEALERGGQIDGLEAASKEAAHDAAEQTAHAARELR